MSVFLPNDPGLAPKLAQSQRMLVVCYCAAWCDTCNEYRPKFEALSEDHADDVFVWVDIEEEPDLLDDEDVENFPTILVERFDKTLFFGTVLPHIGQLERLLQALEHQQEEMFDGPAPKAVRMKLLAAAQ